MSEPTNFWKSFLRMPKTPRSAEITKRTFNRTVYIRELILHIIFLVAISLITVDSLSSTKLYLSSVLTYRFIERADVSFHHISTIEEFWTYTEDILPDILFKDKAYNPDLKIEKLAILHRNSLIGTARLRQLRVQRDTCTINKHFKPSVGTCYGPYSDTNEFKGNFGPGNGTPWTYGNANQVNGISRTGFYSSYTGGGFFIDLTPTSERASKEISYLKNHTWIDKGTRAVFIDFTVHNPSVDLICIIKLMCEFPITGGVTPSWEFRTGDVKNYDSIYDKVVLGCEIVVCLFIVYFIFQEVTEIYLKRLAYLLDIWNLIDVSLLVLAIVGVGLGLYKFLVIKDLWRTYHEQPTSHINFEAFGYWEYQYQIICGVVAFLSWIKLFQFLCFNSIVINISNSLSRCVWDLLAFGFMYLVVFTAFAQLGLLVFGSKLRGFRDLGSAIFTLMKILFGDGDFDSMQQAHYIMGPLYYIAFIAFVVFVLMQMYLAIIADSYYQTKNDYEAISHPTNPFVAYSRNFVHQGRQDGEDMMDLTAVTSVLKHLGFENDNIKAFIDDNYIDEHTRLTMNDLEQLMNGWGKMQAPTPLERRADLGRTVWILQQQVRELEETLERRRKEEHLNRTKED